MTDNEHLEKVLKRALSGATSEPLTITDALLSMKASMPAGSRMMACASMAVIMLDEQVPTNRDIDACIGFLRAMKASVK